MHRAWYDVEYFDEEVMYLEEDHDTPIRVYDEGECNIWWGMSLGEATFLRRHRTPRHGGNSVSPGGLYQDYWGMRRTYSYGDFTVSNPPTHHPLRPFRDSDNADQVIKLYMTRFKGIDVYASRRRQLLVRRG